MHAITNFIDSMFAGANLLLALLIFMNPLRLNRKANRWFAVFLMCLFLMSADTVLQNSGMVLREMLANIISLSGFIVAPIFYLSVLYYVKPARSWRKRDYAHFAFMYFFLLLIMVSVFFPTDPDAPDISPEAADAVILLFNIINSGQVMCYCMVAFCLIRRHQRDIRLYTATVHEIDLTWLQQTIIAVMGMAVLWILDFNLNLSERFGWYDALTSVLYLAAIVFIGYHMIRQKELFPQTETEKQEINTVLKETEALESGRKKIITEDKLEEVKSALTFIMDFEKPYLNCEISLVSLAARMQVSAHVLSYAINEGFGENFFQYINRHRIAEAEKLLADPAMNHLTLLGIAFQVGFNSKTVFNTTFKRSTGLTPTDFKRSSQAAAALS